jgi:alkylation response protein AidB-like acyl-CoA dehydrogenase
MGCRFDAGLAWVHFPRGLGGIDAPAGLQRYVDLRLLEAGIPRGWDVNPIGFGQAAPTIVNHGTQDQKERHLRPIYTGEEI